MAAGKALGLPGLMTTLVDLLIILKVKLGRLLHGRLSRVGIGLTALAPLDSNVLKVKARPARENPGAIDLSCLGMAAGGPLLNDAALGVLASPHNCQPLVQHLHIFLAH